MAGPIRRLFRRSRPAALGLRRRILLIITLGSIALSVFLATTTFGLTRSNLVTERDEAAIATSRRNALGVERDLRPTLPSEPVAARASLDAHRRPALHDLVPGQPVRHAALHA